MHARGSQPADRVTYNEPGGPARMAGAAAKGAAKQRRPALAEIKKIINVVSDADAKKFLAAELRRDEDMLKRFGDLAGRSLAASRGEDYYAKVERLLKRGSGGGVISHHTPYISLAGVTKDAKAREKIGDYVEAARIYGQIAEAIIDYLPRIYSVTERFRDQASRCIQAMGGCAEKASNAGARRHIARYLADGYARDYEGMWADEYEAALDKVIHGPDDERRLREVVEKVLSAGPPDDPDRGVRDSWGKYLREYCDGIGGGG